MDNVKPWQILLFVAAIGVLGFSVWKFGIFGNSVESQMANSITMIDVETGQLFEYSLKGRRGVMVPSQNPETGKLSLMPINMDDEGVWRVSQRDLSTLQYVETPVNTVDRGSGIANPTEASPIRVAN